MPDLENVRPHEWHLERGVSLSHLFSTLILASSFIAWAITNESRISRMEAVEDFLTARVDVLDSRQLNTRDWINDQFQTSRDSQTRAIEQMSTQLRDSMLRLETKLDSKQDKE